MRVAVKKKGEALIRNWRVVSYRNGESRLYGRIYHHPELRDSDGLWATTSDLVDINEEEGWAETMNTMYTLEEKAR